MSIGRNDLSPHQRTTLEALHKRTTPMRTVQAKVYLGSNFGHILHGLMRRDLIERLPFDGEYAYILSRKGQRLLEGIHETERQLAGGSIAVRPDRSIDSGRGSLEVPASLMDPDRDNMGG